MAYQMDETHCIHRARQGDLEAFNSLALAYQDLVFQHAFWMLGEMEAAQDVAQKIFLLAYRELRSFQDGDFRGWLLRMASRLCLEKLRWREQDCNSSRGTRDHGGEDGISAFRVNSLANLSEGHPGPSNLEEVIREGVRELSPDHRAVITLVDLQGIDYRKTAEILGISEGSVKSRLARARVQLRDRLLTNGGQGP